MYTKPDWMRTARDDALEMARALQLPNIDASEVERIVVSLQRWLGDGGGDVSLSQVISDQENERISPFDTAPAFEAVDRLLGKETTQHAFDLGGADPENLAGTIPQFKWSSSGDNDRRVPQPVPLPSLSGDAETAMRKPASMPILDQPTSSASRSQGPIELLADLPARLEKLSTANEGRLPLDRSAQASFGAASGPSSANDGSMPAQLERKDLTESDGAERPRINEGQPEQDLSVIGLPPASFPGDDERTAAFSPPGEGSTGVQLNDNGHEPSVTRPIVLVSIADTRRLVDDAAEAAAAVVARQAQEIIEREIDDDNFLRHAQRRALYWHA